MNGLLMNEAYLKKEKILSGAVVKPKEKRKQMASLRKLKVLQIVI